MRGAYHCYRAFTRDEVSIKGFRGKVQYSKRQYSPKDHTNAAVVKRLMGGFGNVGDAITNVVCVAESVALGDDLPLAK
jgi:hypothetical protein